MQYLQTIRLILSLLPLILTAVKAIEEALPAGGNGREKLALVRTTIESGYNLATDTFGDFQTLWPAIERVIGAAVSMFNAAGVFRK